MNETKREEFLNRKPRLGNLTTLRVDGSPSTVPLWFEWDGEVVKFFTPRTSSKLTNIANDDRASLTVVNDIGESEAWVSFEGRASVEETGGMELADRLAPRYWDVSDPETQAVLEAWRAEADEFRMVTITPSRIRTFPPESE